MKTVELITFALSTPAYPVEKVTHSKLDEAEEIIITTAGQHQGLLRRTPYHWNLLWRINKIMPIVRFRTAFQEIILAKFGGGNRVALFQDGEWQFLSGKDAEGEFHKYEAKLPASLLQRRGIKSPRVLIIGGGDG